LNLNIPKITRTFGLFDHAPYAGENRLKATVESKEAVTSRTSLSSDVYERIEEAQTGFAFALKFTSEEIFCLNIHSLQLLISYNTSRKHIRRFYNHLTILIAALESTLDLHRLPNTDGN